MSAETRQKQEIAEKAKAVRDLSAKIEEQTKVSVHMSLQGDRLIQTTYLMSWCNFGAQLKYHDG